MKSMEKMLYKRFVLYNSRLYEYATLLPKIIREEKLCLSADEERRTVQVLFISARSKAISFTFARNSVSG